MKSLVKRKSDKVPILQKMKQGERLKQAYKNAKQFK